MKELMAITGALFVAIGVWQLWHLQRGVRVWRRFRGRRVVTCPEAGGPEAVQIDVLHAAMTALVHGAPAVRLASCTRWPARGPCDQPCAAEASAPASSVLAIATHGFAGRACVFCRKPIADMAFLDHHAALLTADGETREWPDVPAERLPEALRTDRPVCWNCHVAETFRRTHPELVTDRSSSVPPA